MADKGSLSADPNPECAHQWRYVGMTTIVQPEIEHWACPACRTFRHTRLNERYAELDHLLAIETSKPNETWYTKEWTQGPWTEDTWASL